MTDKAKFFEQWLGTLGHLATEQAWQDKQSQEVARGNYYVMGDIQPYQSMQTGEMIMGRRQHREHLKQHRLIEIGNEPIRETRKPAYNSDEVKREITRHIYNH